MNSFEGISCRLCRNIQIDLYCEKDGFKIYRCNSCGNGFLDQSNLPMNLVNLYEEDYHKRTDKNKILTGYDDYYASKDAFEKTFHKRLKKILNCLESKEYLKERNLLDIGCGPGFFLKLAQDYFKVTGIEISRQSVDYAKNTLGLNVFQGEFRPGIFESGSFDVITMFDTIEHLIDPVSIVKETYRLLRSSGMLILTTGDISSLCARFCGKKWHLMTLPDHLYFFSKEGLIDLLQKEGFSVVSVSYPSAHFTIDYLLERLIKSFNLGQIYLKWSSLRKSLSKIVLPMNLWDIMFIIVQKR